GWVFQEKFRKSIAEHGIRHRTSVAVSEFRFRLPLELRASMLDGLDCRHSFAHIFSRQVFIVFLEYTALSGVIIDNASQRRSEPRFMGPSFIRMDIVGERE